jgi:hypothetical protein
MTRLYMRAIILGALLAIPALGPALAQTPPPPPPPGADTGAPPMGQPPGAAPGARMQQFAARFAAANTTGDGRLTLAQARAGHLQVVVKNFSKIDSAGKGYVTMDDIRAYARVMAQQRKASNPPG